MLRVVAMLSLVLLMNIPIPAADAESPPPNGIVIYVEEGPIESIHIILENRENVFTWADDGPIVDVLYPAALDVYTLDPATPTVQDAPGWMTDSATGGTNDCIRDFSGPLVCWDLGSGIPLRQPVPLPPTDLVHVGTGCIKVYYEGGGSPTVVRTPVSLVPGVGALISGTC